MIIDEIKQEMKLWYSFELTNEQIQEYLDEKGQIESFDTLEREDYAYYLAHKLTGLDWPTNSDSQDYKLRFYTTLIKNSRKMGYIWRPPDVKTL